MGWDSHDHLLAAKQRVADELARAQRDRSVDVGHLGGWMAVGVAMLPTISRPGGFKSGIFPLVVIFAGRLRLGGPPKIPVPNRLIGRGCEP